MDWLANPEIWIALVTLTALEIVLGIDNIIFISILAGKLPAEQDQVASGELVAEERDQRCRQARDPGQRQQQQQPGDEGQRQPDGPCSPLLLGRELGGQDRDEDDVVDTEHNLERRQREKCYPDIRIG